MIALLGWQNVQYRNQLQVKGYIHWNDQRALGLQFHRRLRQPDLLHQRNSDDSHAAGRSSKPGIRSTCVYLHLTVKLYEDSSERKSSYISTDTCSTI